MDMNMDNTIPGWLRAVSWAYVGLALFFAWGGGLPSGRPLDAHSRQP